MNILDGENLKKQGMNRAAKKAGDPWVEKAVAFIRKIAEGQSQVHIDDIDNLKSVHGLEQPLSENAWGAVWSKCLRDGIIVWSGQMKAASEPSKHKRQYRIYTSLIYNDQ